MGPDSPAPEATTAANACGNSACSESACSRIESTLGVIGTLFGMMSSILMFLVGSFAVLVALGSAAVAAQNFCKMQPLIRQPSQHYPTDHLMPISRRRQRPGSDGPDLSFRLQMGSLL